MKTIKLKVGERLKNGDYFKFRDGTKCVTESFGKVIPKACANFYYRDIPEKKVPMATYSEHGVCIGNPKEKKRKARVMWGMEVEGEIMTTLLYKKSAVYHHGINLFGKGNFKVVKFVEAV